MIQYDTLILSGGGYKGVALLGSLQYLYEKKCLKIKNYYGCSIGAIINFLLIIGYTPQEILVDFIRLQYMKKIKINLFSGFSGKGFVKWKQISDIIEDYIKRKISFIPSIKELYTIFKKNYKVVTFNYTKKKEEIIDYLNYPDMSILQCLRMTCNLPFVFDECQYNNYLYYDGFLTNNFPISLVEEKNISIAISSEEIFCKDTTKKTCFQIFDVISVPLDQLQYLKSRKYFNKIHTLLYLQNISTFSLKFSYKNILNLYSDAFEFTKLNLVV